MFLSVSFIGGGSLRNIDNSYGSLIDRRALSKFSFSLLKIMISLISVVDNSSKDLLMLTLSSVVYKRSAFLCKNGAKRLHKNATQFVNPLKRIVSI